MKPIYFIAQVISLIVICGCSDTPVSKDDLLKYCQDNGNGLHKQSEANGILIDVSYRPQDLIVDQEIEGSSYSANQIDSIRNRLNDFDYFLLSISKDNNDLIRSYASDPAMLQSIFEHLSNGIGAYVKLVHNADTLSVYDYMYLNGHGLSESSKILFVFESGLRKKEGNVDMIYKDEFFRTGLNHFEFDIKSIKKIPELSLNR